MNKTIFEQGNISVEEITDGLLKGNCDILVGGKKVCSVDKEHLEDEDDRITMESVQEQLDLAELKNEERQTEWSHYGEEGNY